ncbi:MAG: GHKL domain-containing protein [Peptoanaerobacter stomatis]|uniref:GHKL domain-containing protein n=1 Tax=Peptoanaerobacter stomatis TaxID=796937 RepID=UPI003F9EF732
MRKRKIRSTKRNDFGIGLSSVQSVARKYNGDAKFEDKDGYFQSSVYMRTDDI